MSAAPHHDAQWKSVTAKQKALFVVHLFRKAGNSVQLLKLVIVVGNISLSYTKRQCSMLDEKRICLGLIQLGFESDLCHLVALWLGQVNFFLSPVHSSGNNSSSYLVGLS